MRAITARTAKSEALKAATASVIGTVVMDLFTWNMYRSESGRVHRKEKRAQVEGKWVAHAAAEKLARGMGRAPSPQGLYAAGKAIHFLLGIGPGVAYGLLRRRFPEMAAGKGLLFGFAVFVVNDQLMAPAAGLASGPRHYPWQAHLRGLVGHLAFGVATEAAINMLTYEAEKAKKGW